MRTIKSLKTGLGAAAAGLILTALAGPAAAGVVFTDGTFTPGNYSASAIFTSPGVVFTHAQCAICGNPGFGERFVATYSNSPPPPAFQTGAVGLANTTFAYNPLTLGAITSLSVGVDKNLAVNEQGTGFTNTFRPLILQDSIYYLAAEHFPNFDLPAGGGSTGYQSISSGLAATDFVSYDFTTGTFGVAHPNFAGDPMLFGLAQISTADFSGEVITADYDNLRIAINAPEPASITLFGLGVLGLGLALRRRRSL